MNVEIGLRPRYSQKRNTYMGFSLQCSLPNKSRTFSHVQYTASVTVFLFINLTNHRLVNPTLSITPSKPFVSSGLLFTRVNCMIYYLTHVNYNPAAADLTSIGVTIAPTVEGGGGGGPVRGGRRAGTGREAGRYGEGGV